MRKKKYFSESENILGQIGSIDTVTGIEKQLKWTQWNSTGITDSDFLQEKL